LSTVVQHEHAGAAWSQVPETTIIELVRDACRRDPDRPLLIFEDGLTVTRRDLMTRVESFAAALRDRIAPGDRVAVILGNRAEFMIAWLAVVALRATLVSVNPGVKEHDARHVLRDSEAVLAIISQEHQALVETVRADCPRLRDVVGGGAPPPRARWPARGAGWDLLPRRGRLPASRHHQRLLHVGDDRPAEGLHGRPRVVAAHG
jgi:crotonobetaine/carnitine-CoA ligase